MAQKLIVEGNDAISLANILMTRKMSPPKGYRKPEKFKKEFVKVAGGKSQILAALKETLETPRINRIGIIVDADSDNSTNIAKDYCDFISETLGVSNIDFELSESGVILNPLEDLTIGIWIMPDNSSEGFLEHFLAELIPEGNQTWEFTKEKVNELLQTDFCEFSKIKTQKALVHTYLSWKESPGLPFGTAVHAKYFDAKSSKADAFAKWFETTFELEN